MTSNTRQNNLGDIAVTYVGLMARALHKHGIAPEPLFEQFRVTPELLDSPDARISIPRFMRLGHAAIEAVQDPCLGLEFGACTRLSDMGLAGCAAMAAPTLGEALATVIRFERLSSYNSRGRSRSWEDEAGNRIGWFYSISPYNAYNFFVVDSILAGWTCFLEALAGRPLRLQRVDIEYAPRGHQERFETFFGCPVQFGAAQNAIVLPASENDAPNPLRQDALHRKLVQQCQRELNQIRAGWSLIDRVREALTPLLGGQAPTLEAVARSFGVAPWTLRRQLADHGTTFREVLDKVRKELAQEYVRHTAYNFTEVSYVLGFSSPPAFHRAFVRWYGISPGEAREHWRQTSDVRRPTP
ncbi:AraC family transcriptional regulator [Marinobacteraceae bacterium S3BR75-40.1]